MGCEGHAERDLHDYPGEFPLYDFSTHLNAAHRNFGACLGDTTQHRVFRGVKVASSFQLHVNLHINSYHCYTFSIVASGQRTPMEVVCSRQRLMRISTSLGKKVALFGILGRRFKHLLHQGPLPTPMPPERLMRSPPLPLPHSQWLHKGLRAS